MIRKSILVYLLCLLTVCWMPAAENSYDSLVKAVAGNDALEGETLEYFLRLTPPLLQYLDHASGRKLK